MRKAQNIMSVYDSDLSISSRASSREEETFAYPKTYNKQKDNDEEHDDQNEVEFGQARLELQSITTSQNQPDKTNTKLDEHGEEKEDDQEKFLFDAMQVMDGGVQDEETKMRIGMARETLEAAQEAKKRQEDPIEELTFELEEAHMHLADAEAQIKIATNDMLFCELAKPCQWNTMYRQLLGYKAKYGHCNVPYSPKEKDEANKTLGRFVGNQRVFYRYYQQGNPKHIKPHRIEALNRLGFSWNPQEELWKTRIQQLDNFKAKYGHLNVPLRSEDPEEDKLGKWVNLQRNNWLKFRRADRTTLTPERVQQLTDMGFVWERTGPNSAIGLKRKRGPDFKEKTIGTRGMSPEEVWQVRYHQLLEFKEIHGHVTLNKRELVEQEHIIAEERSHGRGPPRRIPVSFSPNSKNASLPLNGQPSIGRHSLSGWLASQRKQYQYYKQGKPSILDEKKIKMLEQLGVVWQPTRTYPRKSK